MQRKKTLIVLAVPATLALAARGMVAAYAATPTPPAPTAGADKANEPAEAAEVPEAPGAPDVGHVDDPKNTADPYRPLLSLCADRIHYGFDLHQRGGRVRHPRVVVPVFDES